MNNRQYKLARKAYKNGCLTPTQLAAKTGVSVKICASALDLLKLNMPYRLEQLAITNPAEFIKKAQSLN